MKQGSITVFFSLCLVILLAFLGAVLESARGAAQRVQIERAAELAEYSVLSEYHKELLRRYGLFFIDSAYGQEKEQLSRTRDVLAYYAGENLMSPAEEEQEAYARFFQARVDFVAVQGVIRATDGEGSVFYEQAVEAMKDKYGLSLVEDWLDLEKESKDTWEDALACAEEAERQQEQLEDLNAQLEEGEEPAENPIGEVEQLKSGVLLDFVLREKEQLSGKTADMGGFPSKRELLTGIKREPVSYQPVDEQLFHTFLLENMTNAKGIFLGEQEEQAFLNYQVEYILAGKDSDAENLEAVAKRLLLLFEGTNYLYLKSDNAKQLEAQTLALAAAGLLEMPQLVDALKEVILFGWALGESMLDIRALLQGKKVPLKKTAEDWKLSLLDAATVAFHPEKYDHIEGSRGFAYEDYLRMLLTLQKSRDKRMRSLDVAEGVLRLTEKNEHFRIDHCIHGFWYEMQASSPYLFFTPNPGSRAGREWVVVRRCSYDGK